MQIPHNGDSPSGKATDSDSVIRVFESLIPSQQEGAPIGALNFLAKNREKIYFFYEIQ